MQHRGGTGIIQGLVTQYPRQHYNVHVLMGCPRHRRVNAPMR